jgi:hypothetical protein
MRKYIKAILVFINMVFFTDCIAQTIYDPNATKKYDSVYKRLPSRIKETLAQSGGDTSYNHGLAILTEDKTDTLNKSEIGQGNSSEIELIAIDPKNHKRIKSKSPKGNNDKGYPYVNCRGSLSADTLVIQIGDLFFGHAVIHRVLKNNISTFYAEYLKLDKVFKINSTDSLTNLLSIPAETIKFYLCDTAFKIGKTIYGNAEIITNTYFQKDTWEENGFYKLRRRMRYYFKFQIEKV